MTKKVHKYSGAMAEPPPIELPLKDWFVPIEKFSGEGRRVLRKRDEDLHAALFVDCGVDGTRPDGWQRVALVLAERHVPAFMSAPQAKRGRPSERSGDHDLALEIHRLMSERQTIKNAARIVAKRRNPKKSPGERQAEADRLEARYHRYIKDLKTAHDNVPSKVRQTRKARQK